MKKWLSVSFNVTREEKAELEKFKEDYIKKHDKPADYSLNQLLRHCIFVCVKGFYNGKLKAEEVTPKDVIKRIQKELDKMYQEY